MPQCSSDARANLKAVTSSAVRFTVYAGVAAATAYGALKTAWGLGSTVGVTDRAALDRFVAGFGKFEWLATWGTVALAGVAAALLLALVEPWGKRLPRRPLRVAAWLGAVVLAFPGFAGLTESLLTYAGVLETHDNGLAEWVFLLTYASFAMLAVALVVAARSNHRTAG